MSLGAIDFGLIVDGAVIIVENTVRRLAEARHRAGAALDDTRAARDHARSRQRSPEAGAVRDGDHHCGVHSDPHAWRESKARCFDRWPTRSSLALVGALILSLTVIPALSALFLKDDRQRT